MIYSLIGHCLYTGQFGAGVASSSLAAGARVPFAMAGVGAVLSQSKADPRLGPRGLSLLRAGCTAQQTVDALVASTAEHRWRQIAVIDREGGTADFHGGDVRPCAQAAHGPDVVAIGEHLPNDQVPAAMVESFTSNADQPLAERLVRALEAAVAAGGSDAVVWSAALLVVEREDFALIDLRVDRMENAVSALRSVWNEYAPLTEDFVLRAMDPAHARAQSPACKAAAGT